MAQRGRAREGPATKSRLTTVLSKMLVLMVECDPPAFQRLVTRGLTMLITHLRVVYPCA